MPSTVHIFRTRSPSLVAERTWGRDGNRVPTAVVVDEAGDSEPTPGSRVVASQHLIFEVTGSAAIAVHLAAQV